MRIRKSIEAGTEYFFCTDCGCPLEEEDLETLYHPHELAEPDGSKCLIACDGVGLYIRHPDLMEVPATLSPCDLPISVANLPS